MLKPPTKHVVSPVRWADDLIAAGTGVVHTYTDPGRVSRIALHAALKRQGFKASIIETAGGLCQVTLRDTTTEPKAPPEREQVDYERWATDLLEAGVGPVHIYEDPEINACSALAGVMKRLWGARVSTKIVSPGRRMVVLLDAGSYPELRPQPEPQPETETEAQP